MSKSQVSRLCALDEQVSAFRERPLGGRYPYVSLDTKIEKVRGPDGHVRRKALVVAHDVHEAGYREPEASRCRLIPPPTGRSCTTSRDATGHRCTVASLCSSTAVGGGPLQTMAAGSDHDLYSYEPVHAASLLRNGQSGAGRGGHSPASRGRSGQDYRRPPGLRHGGDDPDGDRGLRSRGLDATVSALGLACGVSRSALRERDPRPDEPVSWDVSQLESGRLRGGRYERRGG
jgi:Transposase, Mutator family